MRRLNAQVCQEHPNRKNLDSTKRCRRFRHLWLLSALVLGAWVTLALAEDPAGKDLRLFYQQNCVGCHGIDGSALGPDGKKLKGQDLTDERWRQNTDDGGMVNTILNGKFFGLAMPRFKNDLSREEAQRMVTEIIRKTEKGVPIEPATTEPDEK